MKRLYILIACLIFLSTTPVQAQLDPDLPKAEKVIVGMYINDIYAIDMASYSYGVDLYLWFRWFNPEINPAEGFEFMNMYDPEGHVEEVFYDEPQKMPDGSLYQLVRHQGLFISKFPLRTYPFDRQELLIAIEDAEYGSKDVQYIPDQNSLSLNPEINLTGYDINPWHLDIRDKIYPTYFGDLSDMNVGAYSRADFIVPITRPAFSGIVKNFLPLILIILSAAFAILLDPVHVDARIGLSITALLTLVAMQFTMQSMLPEVSYLTLLDQVYLLSYFYILCVIAAVVYGTRIDQQGAIRGDKKAMKSLAKGGPVIAVTMTATYLVALEFLIAINLAIG